jgi:hypothetical protein
MEMLGQSLNMAASILTIVATLVAFARDIPRRRRRSNEYVVKQSYSDDELTDDINRAM